MNKPFDDYYKAITSGVVNGYSLIDYLENSQVKILCNIAKCVSGMECSTKEDLKNFTKQHSSLNDKFFDRYIKNVANAYTDLVSCK